ncbi:beta-ketoacyl synthase chain length factor [Treponema sp.]|uniref:beta-ketoacyl synthase chain length factor n=1 Tax=Treponema sp. TaxID=166 RepID=UPI0025DAAE73|nr:beta-ketoacyl synthase chain length factor [Treponema sp.]MCR5218050.1 beta-ketoacyl synthase chain length factor [Treponema sp.]
MILYFSKAGYYIPDAASPDASPKLEFTSPLFRRRLSQLTKMIVQVIHDVTQAEGITDIKQVFISKRGDISREFSINEQLINDGEILPAGFSLSVFNTPVAQASLALKLKSGYSVIFPSQGNIYQALQASLAPVICGDEKEILIAYGDEYIQEEYGTLRPEDNQALAFAFIASAEKKEGWTPIEVSSLKDLSPVEILEKLK